MKFLIDRCVGRLLADWLRKQGHDVVESCDLGPDPGERALLDWAAKETRILITIGIKTKLRSWSDAAEADVVVPGRHSRGRRR